MYHILNCSVQSNDGADAFAKDDDSLDVIEDGEAQEASVALVEDWRNTAAHNVIAKYYAPTVPVVNYPGRPSDLVISRIDGCVRAGVSHAF